MFRPAIKSMAAADQPSKPPQPLRWVRFGDVELDARAGELHTNGRRIRLQNQPFQLLALLLEHPGEVVTQDAIRAKLWASDTVVEYDPRGAGADVAARPLGIVGASPSSEKASRV